MTEAEKKAQLMRKKTELIQRAFNLPDTESVIQDYSCCLWKTLPHTGRMYVTQRYVCFIGSLTTQTHLQLRKVTSIELSGSSILLKVGSEETYFGAFMNRNEVYVLLEHLWQHPPTYVTMDNPQSLVQGLAAGGGGGTGVSGGGGGMGVSGGGGHGSGSGYGSGMGGGGLYAEPYKTSAPTTAQVDFGGTGQKQKYYVDTEASKRSLQILANTKDMASSTIVELQTQGEQLDRIQQSAENIHGHLDQADRYMKGIESVGGALSNYMSGGADKKVSHLQSKDFSRQKFVNVEVDILHKLRSDDLIPAKLIFENDAWMITENNKLLPSISPQRYSFNYSTLSKLVMRARPEHMDIRFSDGTRVRLMSSFLQLITNEFVLRSQANTAIVVEFEPGSTPFVYGKPRLTELVKTKESEAKQANSSGFVRGPRGKVGNVSEQISSNVDDGTKSQLQEVEKNFDLISAGLSDLGVMARQIGTTTDTQNEQLDYINDLVETGDRRIKKMNTRVNNQL